jgi:hypothetical protein
LETKQKLYNERYAELKDPDTDIENSFIYSDYELQDLYSVKAGGLDSIFSEDKETDRSQYANINENTIPSDKKYIVSGKPLNFY